MKIVSLIVFLIFNLVAHQSLAGKRIALVIGNAAYDHAPKLANPGNDAHDVSDRLRSLGFKVFEREDIDLASSRTAIREFIQSLSGADIAIFYYAGHAIEADGENYMLPTDARLRYEDDLKYETISLTSVQAAMEQSAKHSLIFLDACRDNPLAQNLARSLGSRSAKIGRGLSQMGAGVGTMIAYSTHPGNVALDGLGRNSPFTTALLKHLGHPGDGILDTMRKVRNDVLADTEGAQVPWENNSLTEKIVLSPEDTLAERPGATADAIELAY